MNGGDALVATLLAHGLDTAFCVPGESYVAVLEALRAARERLRLITNRHEGGASFAAEAYGKLTGKPGIAFVTRAPGATNAAIGVHVAAQGSSPLVLFVGDVPSRQKGLEAFQEIDYGRMFGPIAKAVIEPRSPAEVAAATARALRLAVAGRPGPVVVALPEDVTEGDAGEPAIPPPVPRPVSAPPAEAVTRAAAMIAEARHPLAIFGEMVGNERAHAEALALIEASGAAAAVSFRRQDCFPADHPAFIGHLGIGRPEYLRAALAECDLVIAAGSRLDAVTSEGFTLVRDDQRLIQIYPEASVVGRARDAELGIVCDVRPALSAIAGAVAAPPPERLAWRERVNRGLRRFMAEPLPAKGAVDPAAVVGTVAERLADRPHVIVNDAGNFASWLHRFYPYVQPQSQVGAEAGAMGGAVPGAIAAALARPEACVVAFAGDGGFLMTASELTTAVMERLPVRLIVGDNAAYGTILMHQHRYAGPGRYHGVALRSPDFAALARSCGAAAWTVRRTADFAPAFDAALAEEGPALIHLALDIRDISATATLEG